MAPVIAVSLRQPSGASGWPSGILALIAWLLTAGIGGYMLRTWIARGGLRRQRATGVGVPPAVVFGHAGAAVGGLAVWLSYLGSGWHPLAWLGVVLIATAITLGICMVTVWTPYPILPAAKEGEPAASEGEEFPRAAASQPDPSPWPDVTLGMTGGSQAAAEHPEAFTVTDEMIARLLAEPPNVRRRRRLQLLPLIPACHGFAALATFVLATLAAVNAR